MKRSDLKKAIKALDDFHKSFDGDNMNYESWNEKLTTIEKDFFRKSFIRDVLNNGYYLEMKERQYDKIFKAARLYDKNKWIVLWNDVWILVKSFSAITVKRRKK